MRLTGLSFEDWIEHAFSHEVRLHGNAWFFDDDPEWWDPSPDIAVAYLTRLFEEPEAALAWFSDEQIAQGLRYLVSTSATGDNRWISSTEVAPYDRLRCISAISSFFARLFAPRCTPDLSHVRDSKAGPLNTVCYMWWDEFPSIALPGDPCFEVLHDAALRSMVANLSLPSIACQESSLHGLGHWQRWFKNDVEGIIDEFLEANSSLGPQLATYARSARCGCVL